MKFLINIYSNFICRCKGEPSPIWKHVLKTNDKNLLKCSYCQKEIKVCGNTTNMLKHLKSQHPLFFETNNKNTVKSVKRPIENDTEPEAYTINKQKKQATVSIFCEFILIENKYKKQI